MRKPSKLVTPRRGAFRGLYEQGGTATPCQGLTSMTYTLARLISVAVLGAAVTGCATVPGDPYYEPAPYRVYEQPGYIHSNAPPVYSSPQPVYPAYSAPPPVIYYGGRDRDDRWERDRNRGDWRERERERERAERDRQARERERDRRDQQAREADRRQRDRDQALRDQAERDRRAADDRRNREAQPGRMAPGSYTPHPQDWRSRQQSNNPDKP